MYNRYMIRYMSQPANSNICGPVAIINIMKFFGFRATKNNLSFVKFQCRYENGTDEADITSTLKTLTTLKFFIRKVPTIEQIDKHLNNNGSILMLTVVQDKKETFGHYWIITDLDENGYTCHNLFKTNEYLTRKELEKQLAHTWDDMPKAWFISHR